MPISDKDRELWRMAMKDVKPLDHDCVSPSYLATGSFAPKQQVQRHTWDLHGLTMKQAHDLTLNQIDQLQQTHKWATFITGKSGQINREFSHWLERNPHVRNVEVTNSGGAYRVWFKTSRQNKK